jgi:myo-inositol-1(or 4)-monophosphatase
VATGINSRGTPGDLLQLKQMAQITPAVAGIRRTGSACTDLAWLASGRLDGYWESQLHPWDIAAGWLLLREAGGTMTDYSGKPGSIWNCEVVAGNETLQVQLLKVIKTVK